MLGGLDPEGHLATLVVGLGQPLLELAFHELLQVLVSHSSLVVHVKGELPPVAERELSSERAMKWALLGARRQALEESLLYRRGLLLVLLGLPLLLHESLLQFCSLYSNRDDVVLVLSAHIRQLLLLDFAVAQ